MFVFLDCVWGCDLVWCGDYRRDDRRDYRRDDRRDGWMDGGVIGGMGRLRFGIEDTWLADLNHLPTKPFSVRKGSFVKETCVLACFRLPFIY